MPCTLVNKDVPRTCQGLIGRKITIILSLGMRTFAHHAFYLIITIMKKTTIIYNISIILGLYVEIRHSSDPSDTAISSDLLKTSENIYKQAHVHCYEFSANINTQRSI